MGNELPRAAEIAHAPAGHGEGLGKAVENDGVVAHALNGGNAVVRARVGQLRVDFIGNHEYAAFAQHIRQCAQFALGHHRAGGVVGIGQDDGLGLRRNVRLYVLRGNAEAIFRPGGHGHAHAV